MNNTRNNPVQMFYSQINKIKIAKVLYFLKYNINLNLHKVKINNPNKILKLCLLNKNKNNLKSNCCLKKNKEKYSLN
jgi:hypothetical protein